MPLSVDIVVVAYNRYTVTDSCLRHLQAQTVPHRLIVVDNGSSDDTRARLRAEWPAADLICLDHNRGYPKACNLGVASGSGDVVVLVNNDVDCRADMLEHLIAPLEDPSIGSVASLMLWPGGEKIDNLGLTADPTLACFPRLHGLPTARVHDVSPVLVGPAGTVAAYRRAAWEQVGGFDETIISYDDDFDLALRLRTAGWGTAKAPNAVGIHLGSTTHGYRSTSQRYDNGFGRGYTLRRYGLPGGWLTLRTLATEALTVVGDAVISRDLAALRGRVTGWREGRVHGPLPRPPAEAIDWHIGFRDSLARRYVSVSSARSGRSA
jgi:N-acetylglucosaminyl-diphospho-decaprenol L-rhamnosyltransferase